jgi:hypothetical protein
LALALANIASRRPVVTASMRVALRMDLLFGSDEAATYAPGMNR